MDARKTLEINDLSKFYGQKLIFRHLKLAVDHGEFVIITGNNGAGKSTLLRIIAGLSAATTGQVLISPSCVPAYLGHASYLYPGLTALENLLFWSRAWRLRPDKPAIQALLERLGLAFAAQEQTGKFSRGMIQRLNFGRVLLLQPTLFLLDEPFSGLDADSRSFMKSELAEKRKAGAAIVMISHDAANECDGWDQLLRLDREGLRPAKQVGC